jgi:hypothetical protein
MRGERLIFQVVCSVRPNTINMKSRFKLALLALSGAALFASPAMGAISLESGSLAIAFYQVVGGVVQNNTYTFDLGQASLYRENTGYNVSVSTVNGGLTSSNIGANWANDGTVRWMVVGNVGQNDATVGGDPARTSYYSRSVSTIPQSGVSTTIPSISSTNRGALSNSIEPFFDGINAASQTVGVNPAGAIVTIGGVNTVEDFLPNGVRTTYFGLGINPYQVLGAGTIGNNSSIPGTYEGALDIYRVLHTTDGADLTSAYSTGNAVAGTGQYIGTLVLGSDGNLSIIPEPSAAVLGLAGLALCFRRRRNA